MSETPLRIAYITAGAGGMYCGSCLHDNTLARALRRRGHDVALIPTYTPIRTDETDGSIDQVFYGAVNVYLEQKSALFRHTPWLVDRLLNGPRLLSWIARRGSTIDPAELGDLTLSVLEGEQGRQRKELEKLVAWLETDFRPDIVHITNSMLVGLARRIKQRLGVPVLCSLQGEDLFLESLAEPFRRRVHDKLIERVRDADGLVVNSDYYGRAMTEYLRLPPGRLHLVRLGLNLDGHGAAPPPADDAPFTIGYMARQCPEKGLHLLVEAFRRLAEASEPGAPRLRVAGYLGPRDEPYVEEIRRQVRGWGLDGAVEFLGEVDRAGKIALLQSLHVLSVPTIYREPKGLFVLEALANAVPVVVPSHGAFPELIEATGGGVLVEPESADALATGLLELRDDPGRRGELGRHGQRRVRERFSDEAEARAMLDVYAGVADACTSGGGSG